MPLQEFVNRCSGFEIFQQCSDGDAGAGEDERPAHFSVAGFDCFTSFPVHSVELTGNSEAIKTLVNAAAWKDDAAYFLHNTKKPDRGTCPAFGKVTHRIAPARI